MEHICGALVPILAGCKVATFTQELVEIVGRSTGIALMAPPADSDTAQQTLNTLLSAVNKKQKVTFKHSIRLLVWTVFFPP